jgi:hypothetical protein
MKLEPLYMCTSSRGEAILSTGGLKMREFARKKKICSVFSGLISSCLTEVVVQNP